MTEDRRERARTLLRETQADPDPADAPEFADMLDAEDPTVRRYGLDGLKVLARRDPSVLTERIEQFTALLEDPDQEVRAGATALFAESLSGEPVADAADVLVTLLEDGYPIVEWNALEALVEAARTDTDAVVAYVEDVRPFLDTETEHVRTAAARFMGIVSIDHPEAVAPALDPLLEILVSGGDVDVGIDGTVRRQAPAVSSRVDDVAQESRKRLRDARQAAGHAIYEVAKADPAAVRPVVADVAGLLDDSDPQVRHVALDVFVALASDDPETLDGFVDRIAARLDDDAAMVRASACQALTAVSAGLPEQVAPVALDHVDTIVDLLDHDDATIRASAASLLALAADRDPDAIAPARERLSELREDDAAFVREAAADALADR